MQTPGSRRSNRSSCELASQLLLAGELGNSSASDAATLERIWPRLVELKLNTVLVPIYWELLEPEEGIFDFSLLLKLLELARQHQQKLILLWFGTWKNSMSCYTPAWVKTNPERFPRARLSTGAPVEILSPFSTETLETDRRAFVRLMSYLAAHDQPRTVIAVQVENEIGMLVNARDHSDGANQSFCAEVPREVFEMLAAAQKGEAKTMAVRRHREQGCPNHGNWAEVFGEGLATDELFMAYYFARFVDELARAGKAVHPLPLFVNAALNRPHHKPGEYPSAGPLPHLFDLWQLGAPHLDLLAPDIYYPDFEHWCHEYQATGTLLIPEASRGPDCVVNALYAIGACGALGYSPFSIEDQDPKEVPLGELYAALDGLKDEIVARRNTDAMGAAIVTRDAPKTTLSFSEYRFSLRHDYTWDCSGPARLSDTWPKGAALVLQMGPDEFIVVGTGVIITFDPASETARQNHERAGILFIEELSIENGRFKVGRRLNGDENHQGRHLRIPAPWFGVQRVRLYRYR